MNISNPNFSSHRVLVAGVSLAVLVILVVVAVVVLGKKNIHHGMSLTMVTNNTSSSYMYDTDTKIVAPARMVGNDAPIRSVSTKTGEVAYVCNVGTAEEAICIYNPQTNQRLVVSKNTSSNKQALQWSPDGSRVVYIALTGTLATTTPARTDSKNSKTTNTTQIMPYFDPNQWGVFVAKADGSGEIKIAQGTTPFFSPDGSLVFYLERRGLFSYALTDGKSTIAWPVSGGVAQRFMQIVVSPDGGKLAWSDIAPGKKDATIHTYVVRAWNPFYMVPTEIGIIKRRAWSLQFSPDGASLAWIQYNNQDQAQLWTQPLAASANSSVTPIKAADLYTYGRLVHITDWR